MPKSKLEDWDETAASNTDVGGINIGEGMLPSDVNNAMREDMSQIAKWLGDDTLASAGTTDLGSVPGRYVEITGTTTITALGTIKAGTIKYVKFAGALTLTHNATSLILPGGANITTAAGDTAAFVSEGSGNWRCLWYQRAVEGPYAEGTFTPVLAFGGASVGVTYAANGRYGRYVRVGSKVTVWVYLILTSKGSSTGTATISGLPFTAKTVTGMFWPNAVGYRNFPGPTAAGVVSGASVIGMYNGNTALNNTDFTNTAELGFMVEYEAV